MIPVDDTHSILVQHARIYRYEISKRQTGVRLFPWVVSPSSCSSSCCCCCCCCRYPDAGSLCISALIGVFAASLGTKAPTSVCAALEFRCHLGGPGWPGVVRPGPGPGLYRHVPSWPAGARPCTRAHLSAARRCLVRRWVRPRPAAKPAVECKAARATAPGARPAAQDPRGLPSPRTSLHLSKFCVNTHKFFRLVAIFQRQGGRGLHKHAPDEHTAEGTICFRLRTEDISCICQCKRSSRERDHDGTHDMREA